MMVLVVVSEIEWERMGGDGENGEASRRVFDVFCSLQRIIVAVIRDWIVGSVYACLLDKQHK